MPGEDASPSRRVVLCGGAYSDNLGDAVIADCMAHALAEQLPGAEIVKMDISGRLESRRVGLGPKGRIQTAMDALPPSLARWAVLVAGSLYLKRTIEPAWSTVLRDGDTVVIGGGQLFQDEGLNFPLKMWWLMRRLRRSRTGHAVYAVGVGEHWSALGRRMFGSVFAGPGLRYCSVRDEGSRRSLVGHLPSLAAREVHVDPDPALLAASTYRAVTREVSKAFDIGVGIVHPRTLLIDPRQRHVTEEALTERWRAVLAALLDRGLRVALFSNGAREDSEYLERLARELDEARGLVVLARPTTPAELVRDLAGMRAIVAHRLHASIVGYSLGIPCLGLRWDPKLEQFYAACDRDRWIADLWSLSAGELAALAAALLETPVDPGRQAREIERCRAGVERLATHVLD